MHFLCVLFLFGMIFAWFVACEKVRNEKLRNQK